MARPSTITAPEVFDAVEALLKAGKYPNPTNVREVLGSRGSPPVIQRHIGTWYELHGPNLGAAPATETDATAGLRTELERLTQKALEEVNAAEAAAHQARIDELANQAKALKDELEQLDAARQAAITVREEAVATRSAVVDQRESNLAARELRLDERELAHAEYVADLKSRLEEAQAAARDAATAAAATADEKQRELDAALLTLQAERAQVGTLTERIANLGKDLTRAAAFEQTANEYSATINTLHLEFAALKQAAEQSRRDVDALQAQLALAGEDRVERREAMITLRRQVDQLETQLQDSSADVAQLRRERDAAVLAGKDYEIQAKANDLTGALAERFLKRVDEIMAKRGEA